MCIRDRYQRRVHGRVPLTKDGKQLTYHSIFFLPKLIPEEQRLYYCQNLSEYNYHPLNYKTKPCPYLDINEYCKLEKLCPYLHSEDKTSSLDVCRKHIILPQMIPTLKATQTTSHIPKSAPHSKDKPYMCSIGGEKAYVYNSQVDFQEDDEHEFKAWVFARNFFWIVKTLEEYICAFANTNGGTIHIGITDEGFVTGTICNREIMDRLKLSIDNIRMNLKPVMYQIQVEFKKVVTMHEGKASIIPHTYVVEITVQKSLKGDTYTTKDGRTFIRLLASNRELSGHNLIEYVKNKCTAKEEGTATLIKAGYY
eukprot:TRINITY_DN144_c0_g1_i23.p1 TRINITY_DN144_c0_g1~~TRINITY_DN144_c0_g1_i23.p1  ORF type:complete len:325 (+),score=84.16 TRINITY_DN144_c0_g1_i23:48-977(+)